MDLDFGEDYLEVNELMLTGEGVEILGWLHIRNQVKNGRIFARHGARAVGVAFNEGEGKLIVKQPRKWFEKQQDPQTRR
jgi:hypothetical protein